MPFTNEWPIWTGRDVLQPVLRVRWDIWNDINLPSIRYLSHEWGDSPMHEDVISSNGNIFRVTGPSWGESTGDRWIPLTKDSDAELWCFLWSAPEQTVDAGVKVPSRHYIGNNDTEIWQEMQTCQHFISEMLNKFVIQHQKCLI